MTVRTAREMRFDPELREALGVGPDESLRLLARSARTLVLERARADSMALPWDRELVLSADVRAFPIANVLQMIHESTKSGFLFFENGEHEKTVYLHRGEVVFASSNQTVDRLGECLLRSGVLSQDQHREAKRFYNPPQHFGKVLVERGFLTPRDLWNGVRAQVEEIVRTLFSYGAGMVMVWEGEVRPDNVMRLSLPTGRLIEEGLRRRDELLKLLAWLERPEIRFAREAEAGAELTGTEREVFESLEGNIRFADLCQKVGLDPLSATRTLHHLRLIGAIQIHEQPLSPPLAAPRDAANDAVRERVQLYLRMIEEMAAPIVAVEGQEGLRLRLGKVVEDSARRYPALLAGLEIGPGGSLHPEPIIERALRFPGDREREISLALGELVAYLEFELANHPKIEDPDLFLEGLESLRARLETASR